MKKQRTLDEIVGLKLPKSEGWYWVDIYGDGHKTKVEVYKHPIKGLCVFQGDVGAGYPDTDCHISVQCSGLDFEEVVENS
jgi:hypothetical protein